MSLVTGRGAPALLHVGLYSPLLLALYLLALRSVFAHEPAQQRPATPAAPAAPAPGSDASAPDEAGPALRREWRRFAVAALRLGALDMAIGNLLGSNLFNVVILAVDDLACTRGPLLADVAPVHAGTAATALVMTGLVIVGLAMRPQGRVLRVASWVSVGLVAAYGINAGLLFLAGA